MNRALLIATTACLAVVLGYAGYSVLARMHDEASLPAGQNLSTRPAAKNTCAQAIVTQVPSGMEVSERELVPFSSTQLGVNTVFSDTTGAAEPSSRSRRIEVVSGGYVDELTESYDDLRPIETVSVTGQPVTHLAGSLLSSTVNVVIWRQPGVAPPCDVHAVLATNLSKQQFKAVVKSVRVDRSLASTSRSANLADRDLR
jgi:hypothetical protein